MSRSIVIAAAGAAKLVPSRISPDWILKGAPQARVSQLAKSQDRTSYVMAWDCTPGQFNWHYTQDETVVITAGEVFITIDGGVERRLRAGDAAFFPAGCSATWRVTERVSKVAVLREPLPHALALCVRVWRKSKQLALRVRKAAWASPNPLVGEGGGLWPAVEP